MESGATEAAPLVRASLGGDEGRRIVRGLGRVQVVTGEEVGQRHGVLILINRAIDSLRVHGGAQRFGQPACVGQ